MVAPALAIIQARLKSTRLEKKMLLPLGDTTVIGYAWRSAEQFFGCSDHDDRLVIACPASDEAAFRQAVPEASVFGWDGDPNDVLGRFYACAVSRYCGPGDMILRLTPDDWPLDLLRERFTFAQLARWHATVTDPHQREHIGLLIPQRIEINDQASYEAALRRLEGK